MEEPAGRGRGPGRAPISNRSTVHDLHVILSTLDCLFSDQFRLLNRYLLADVNPASATFDSSEVQPFYVFEFEFNCRGEFDIKPRSFARLPGQGEPTPCCPH